MRRPETGFTLAELAIAMAITAVTALAVAGVSMALSSAYQHGQQSFGSTHSGRTTMRRMTALVRKAKLVTATAADAVALWADDGNGSGTINLSEMAVIAHEAGTREVREYRVVFPDTMAQATRDALDIEVALSAVTDLVAARELVTASPYCDRRLLATDAGSFRVGAAPAAPNATLLKFEVTVGQETAEFTVRSAAALRAGVTDRVGLSGDEYVLEGGG